MQVGDRTGWAGSREWGTKSTSWGDGPWGVSSWGVALQDTFLVPFLIREVLPSGVPRGAAACAGQRATMDPPASATSCGGTERGRAHTSLLLHGVPSCCPALWL